MRRFIYAPEVTAFIRSEEANKVIDVSKDIVSGSVSRRLDATSSATLVLQNKFGLYTRKFKPMDRIAIFMRRIGDPMLVFSGYVDEAPFYQMFPAPVTIEASCTIKLLQNTYFDPGLPFMTQWFMKFGWVYDPSSGNITAPFGGFGNYDSKSTQSKFSDGNLTRLISAALHEIAGWPLDHIFIRSIPGEFKATLHNLMQEEALEYKEDYEHMVATMTAILGIGQGDDVTQAADLPTFTGGNASGVQIAAYARAAGFKGDALILAVAIALAESSGITTNMNFNSNSTYDVGLWQINTVHTSGGGSGLPAPAGGDFDQNLKKWNAIKASVPAGVRAFVENCFNPQFNAAQAYSISSGGQSFTPWSTYNNGAYQAHMVEARKAVDAFLHRKGNDITLHKSGIQINVDTGTSWSDTGAAQGKARTGKSVEGFIAFCKKALGTPYKWGGTDPFHGGADCSGFVQYMYKHYWGIDVTRTTLTQVNAGAHVDKANVRPGDLWLMEGSPPGHVGIYIGNGNVLHDPHTGDVVKVSSIDGGQLPSFTEARRVLPPDVVMGNVDSSGGGASTEQGKAVQDVTQTAREAAWFQLQLPSVDAITSNALSGRRALANDIPLFEWIEQMCKAGGRRFCSMPNGDFLAFFPDYFNDFNRTPYFIIRPIEIIDLQIQVSDRDLVTHVFATGTSFTPQIQLQDRMLSMIASVQEPAFNMFINIDDQSKKPAPKRKGKKKSKKKTTNDLNVWKGAEAFLKRYGARPLAIDLPDLRNPVLLWMAAWMEFQKHWARQFGATASFTFMPELLPGGIVNFDNKITMFVESVTHTFDLEGGFTTSAELNSPAAVNKDDKRFGGMVLAGGNFGVAAALQEDKSIKKDAGPSGGVE
jgi:cell wall-associated NlpC family hydrolase